MRDVLKVVRDLQRRKARERRSLVILEGWRLVEDAMAAGAKVVGLLAAADAEADALIARATAAGIDAQQVPRRDFDAVAGTETPGGGAGAPTAPGKIALVVGSEGHGVRPAWTDLPHRRISIPMRPGAESLNAAVAAAILLFELVRVGH